MTPEELMNEFLETTSYDVVRDWRLRPELGEENDDEPATLEAPGHEFHGNQWTGGFPPDNTVRQEYMSGLDDSAVVEEAGEHFLDQVHDTVDHDSGVTAQEYQEMLHALDKYQGNDYLGMNALLRQDPAAIDEEPNPQDDPPFDLVNAYKLEQLIDEAPAIKKPVLTYRGVESTPDVEKKFKVGSEIQLNGFQSASFDPAVAYNFAHTRPSEARPVILEIRANQGLSLGPYSKVGESEFIIPHGLNYIVRGVKNVKVKASDTVEVRLVQLEMKSAVGK